MQIAAVSDLDGIVCGSANVDIFLPAQSDPKWPSSDGENVLISPATTSSSPQQVLAGGKGLNQAVALRRLTSGSHAIKFQGSVPHSRTESNDIVSSDPLSEVLISKCSRNLIDLSLLTSPPLSRPVATSILPGLGLVFPISKPDGRDVNAIISPGSNYAWSETFTATLSSALPSAGVLLLQQEIPSDINDQILSLISSASSASSSGTDPPITIFDCGGEDRDVPSSPDLAANVITYLTMNEVELMRALARHAPKHKLPKRSPSTDDFIAAGKVLLSELRTVENIIITLGSSGVILVRPTDTFWAPNPFNVTGEALNIIDPTGAGDCFRGALASQLLDRKLPRQPMLEEMEDVLLFAQTCAGLSCTRSGATCPPLELATNRFNEIKSKLRSSSTYSVSGLRGGASSSSSPSFPLKFASRLNSMKDRQDLSSFENDIEGWIKRQGTIRGLDFVDFNFPQHIDSSTDLAEISSLLESVNLKTGAVCLRYPKKFIGGAFTNPNPDLRKEAIELTKEACVAAKALGCDEVVVWSAYDGYDYSLCTDYNEIYDFVKKGFQGVCDAHPDVKVSLEYKPTDENTRFFAIPSTGAAMLLVRDVDRDNFGLTLDFGHCIAAGENPAQSVAVVGAAGKLFGIQLNDGYGRLGAEDGMMFGSVHPLWALDVVYWLRRTCFKGHIYFDTFPHNEDPVGECEYNIDKFKELWEKAASLDNNGIRECMSSRNAIKTLRMTDKL